MSLIKCAECGNDVSEKATNCPHCGNPIATQPAKPVETITRINTVEYTSKKWKAIFTISVLVCFISLIVLLSGMGSQKGGLVGLGILLFVVGFAGMLVAKFGSWWQHG